MYSDVHGSHWIDFRQGDEMLKIYKRELEKYIKYVGAPLENKSKNILRIVVIAICIGCGVLCLIFPENVILAKIGATANGLSNILTIMFFGGGLLMIALVVTIFSNRYLIKRGKSIDYNHAGRLVKILFIFILPLILLEKLLMYILRAGRQKMIVMYMPEIFLSLFISLFLFVTIEQFALETATRLVGKIINIDFKDEFIILIAVVSLIATFFGMSRVLIRFSIKKQIDWEKKKWEIENIDILMDEEVEKKISEKYEYLLKEAEIELKYSELYFFLLTNVILLSCHFDEGTYAKMVENAFMGVTTLAALVREVGSAKQKENDD